MPVLRLMVIFMFSPLETGAAEVTACGAQTARPRIYLLLGHGMWCRGCTAFEMERFRASPRLAVKHMLYSDFFPLKPPLGMPVACLILAESSLRHQFKF